MKVIEGDSVTLIYPFVGEDEEPSGGTVQIIVYPDGGIKLWLGQAPLNTEAARKLAQALLHAAEVAEKGREKAKEDEWICGFCGQPLTKK